MTMTRTILALCWVIVGTGMATAASAQPYRDHGYHHLVCHMEYHHHHRVRVCR